MQSYKKNNKVRGWLYMEILKKIIEVKKHIKFILKV